MAISDAVKGKINKMNRAAQDAVLGTAFQTAQTDIATLQTNAAKLVKGTYTIVAGDQTAGFKTINTGITIAGFIVQVYRAGILLGSVKVTATTTNLKVETNGSDYGVTTGDVINYIVFAA
jgi:hypothetical protein